MQNFQEEVLDRSAQIPVLVDFWAPWCGPCRILGPVLERIAEQQSDRWELVKINTDEHPDLSATYGIRGIPAVKLFVDGEVVDEFTGALPEPAVKQWLDKAIPSENKKLLDEAESAIEAGDTDRAQSILSGILDGEPTNPEACGLLSRLIVWDEPQRAIDLAQCAATGETRLVRLASSVSEIGEALVSSGEQQLPEGPGKEAFERAISALKKSELDSAIEKLINVITVDRYYNDDRARKLSIALFEILGDDHPTTRKYRRQFDMSLY